jgi:ferritin-like metal-binding protein YciE
MEVVDPSPGYAGRKEKTTRSKEMADSKTILQKYVSDMLALEAHIYQAIDKQVKENTDDPEVSSKYAEFTTTLKSHHDTLASRLNALGGAANSPIKEGVSAVFGVAAGLIDKFRSEEVSKNFRDDFTALSLSLVSYQMLHTTALALGDTQTAELAAGNAKDNARFVREIERMMPGIVVRDLKKNHEEAAPAIDESATQATGDLITEIWK